MSRCLGNDRIAARHYHEITAIQKAVIATKHVSLIRTLQMISSTARRPACVISPAQFAGPAGRFAANTVKVGIGRPLCGFANPNALEIDRHQNTGCSRETCCR